VGDEISSEWNGGVSAAAPSWFGARNGAPADVQKQSILRCNH
jgi:hypothetical protein